MPFPTGRPLTAPMGKLTGFYLYEYANEEYLQYREVKNMERRAYRMISLDTSTRQCKLGRLPRDYSCEARSYVVEKTVRQGVSFAGVDKTEKFD